MGFFLLYANQVETFPKNDSRRQLFTRNLRNSELVRINESKMRFFLLYANQVETFPQKDSQK